MNLSQSRRMRAPTGAIVKAVAKVIKPKTSLVTKVSALSKQVKKLNQISYDKVTLKMAEASADSVTTPYYSWHITKRMDLWSPIFGSSTAETVNADKVYINQYKLDVRLVQDNEADRIFYSAFIVSLKDQAADSVTFDPATGALAMSDGVHYATLSTQGRVLVSPKIFNIHSYKRFTMGGRTGDQSTPETRDLSFTIKPKQKVIMNPKGNVFGNALFTFPKDPSQNYYFLLFNDDNAVDLQTNKIYIGGLASCAVAN